MRRSLVLSFSLAVAAAACQSQTPHGTGPIALQPNVQLALQRYLDRPEPIVFLVSADGLISYGRYCPHFRCEPDPLYILAESRCADLAGQPCKVFAENRTITWQGPVAYASPGDGAVAGASVDWGETGTLHGLRIDGLASGTGTFSGHIRERACRGAIDIRSLSWRLECGVTPSGVPSHDDLRAQGSLSKSGAGQWTGFGWSGNRPVRLFVTQDIALGRGTDASAPGAPAFPHQPPTFEEPAPPRIGGNGLFNRG